MLIKPIEKLYVPGGNIIETNKLRMKSIQKNISSMMTIEDLFYRLQEAIIEKDIIAINVIVSENMFFEEIFEGYEKEIIKAYESQTDKEKFLRDLKKSYMIRGIKGFQFAWMPIILRKGKNYMKQIKEIINLLRETSGTNDKISILKMNSENELLKKILEYTYNPYKKYGVSEKIMNNISSDRRSSKTIFELLDILSSNNINDSLREDIGAFKNANIEDWDLYEKMILKDLRCNISSKTINKVWPELIPTSETGVDVKCMLASKFDFEKPPNGNMFITEKLDGMRIWAMIDDIGNIELYTRQGKLVEGCIQVENAISELGLNNVILDGELLATGCSYENVYKETIKRAKNKNEVKTGLAFHVFDIITMEEYQNKMGTRRYSERRKIVDTLQENEFVKIVPLLYKGNNMDEVLKLLDEYRAAGAEGLMCNIDKVYEFKRSKGCLKLKVMQTMDLKIIDFIEGTGKYVNMLGALVVDFKGNSVGIGTGFSDDDRKYIWDNRDKLLGRVVELRYFEITKDKNGIESLRFPSYVCIREEGKEVSYN